MTYRMLISSPSDVPVDDLQIVCDSIGRWNGIYGQQFASTIVPVSWGTHAAAVFGKHPQTAINEQLVDSCDMCVALFANRLGTPTVSAESGTVDEIDQLNDAGKYVAVLRSRRPVKPSMIDCDQAKRLEEYMMRISGTALVLDYEDDAELQLQAIEPTVPQKIAEVWPRVEFSDRAKTDSKGRFKTTRNWYLVLENTGDAPAKNVQFVTEASEDESGEVWFVHAGNSFESIEFLAPHGTARFSIFASLGSAQQVQCTVTWTDERGQRSNTATLRLN